MTKSLATQIEEKKAEQLTYIVKVVLPVFIFLLVAFYFVGKELVAQYSVPMWNYFHPSPTPTPTATQTLIPTVTFTPTPTPTLTPTLTLTPTPTPLPLIIIVNWGGVGVFELASPGSGKVSNGYLPKGMELELIRYCSPKKGEYWGLVRYANRYSDYGWVVIESTFRGLVVKNDRRPILDLILKDKDLFIECPDKYTPVP